MEIVVIDLPVYHAKSFDYVRSSEMENEFERLELERFMFGQTQPLIQGPDGTWNDCIFLWDYVTFLDYKAGKRVLLD